MKKALITCLSLLVGFIAFAQPATQTTNISFTTITSSSITLNWTNGDGIARLVIASDASPVASPADFTAYTADAFFGIGDFVVGGGGSSYVVYDGTGTTVTVTGLAPYTSYYFQIFEYNSGPLFNTSSDTGNPASTMTSCATAGSDFSYCGSSAALSGSGLIGGTGTWSVVSGSGSFVDSSDPNTTFNGTPGTSTTLAWTVVGGSCPGYDEVVVTLDENPTAPLAGTPQTVCTSSVYLDANTPIVGSGYWSAAPAGGFFLDPTDPDTEFSGSPGQSYTVTWTIANGSCSPLADNTTITFENPVSAFAGTDVTVCGPTAMLGATSAAPGLGEWSIISGPAGMFSNINAEDATFDGELGATYILQWSVTNGSCPPATDEVQVYFDTPVGASDIGTVCSTIGINYGLQGLINSMGNNVPSDFSWSVSANPNVSGQTSGAGDILTDVPVNVTNTNEVLVYTVTPVSELNLCTGDPFTVTITVGAIPVLSTTLDKTVNNEAPVAVTLDTDPGSIAAGSYTLNFVLPNGMTPNVSNVAPGFALDASAIYNDSYTNTTNEPQGAQYNITPVSAIGCEGSAAFVNITVNAPKISETDSLALVALYDATYDSAGVGWYTSNWVQDGTTVNAWDGVVVDAGRVISINLSFNNLTGTLPVEIGDLTALQYLNLDGNKLTGPIPTQITNLTNLATLHMAENDFTGSIPANIGNLVNLYGLALSDNNLSGAIPASFSNMAALSLASLNNNQLSGSIPSNIGNLLSLTQLNLGNNNLSGTIPVSMGDLVNLTDLSLNNNQLSGTIPASFDGLVNLDLLDVSYNNLSGIFPDLPSLVLLADLFINNNGFTNVPSFATASLANADFSYNFLNFAVLEQITVAAPLVIGDFSIFAKAGGITFGPQNPIPVGDTVAVTEGAPFSMTYDAGGSGTTYQWIKYSSGPIAGETSTIFDDSSAEPGDAGKYFIEATNATFPFTIITTPFTVEVYSANSSEESGYTFLTKIGSEALGLQQNFPGRIVVDSNGDIYTIDNFARINKYNSAGGLIATINAIGAGEGKVSCASDLEIDASDNLLISSECDNKILKYDPVGNFILEIALPVFQNSVYGIATNASNDIYAAPRVETPYRIERYDSAGIFVGDIYISGGPVYQSYIDLEVDGVGNLYLSDPASQRIDKYLPDGTYDTYYDLAAAGFAFFGGWDFTLTTSGDLYLQSFGFAGSKIFHFGPAGDFIGSFGDTYLANPIGITATADGILVGDEYAGITLFNEAGAFIKTIGPVKNAQGQFNDPQDIAIDSKGNRYIADKYNNRIQKFDASGNFIAAFGTRGTAAGQFRNPVAIIIDLNDNVFVVDQGNSRIQKFTSEGTHILSFGSNGAADGQFNKPFDIALSIEGNILVAEGGPTARIQRFTSEGVFVSKFGSPGTGAGQFLEIKAITTMRSGDILAFDTNARLQRFDKDGGVISEVKLLGALNSQVNDMETDGQGALYVAHGNGAIKKFDINGSLLTNVGAPVALSAIPADGEILFGTAVAANADGDTLWIADASVNRISIFVAQPKALSAEDLLALQDLYNATDGPNWTVNTNWLTPLTENWYGVTITGGKVRSIVLPFNNLNGQLPPSLSSLNDLRVLDLGNNNLTGGIPDAYTALTSLAHMDLSNNNLSGDVKFPAQVVDADLSNNNFNKVGAAPFAIKRLDVSFNSIDSLADLSATLIDSLKVEENMLTFEDLEPNITIPAFTYSPQDSVEAERSVLRELGVTDTIKSTIGGSANIFKWFKDGVVISGESLKWLIFQNVAVNDDAIYHYEATNTIVPGLTLTSRSTEFKVSSLRRDSIALHALYLATNGAEWVNNDNWITTPLSENNWHGVTISENRVTAVELPENNLIGSIPALLADIQKLDTLNFAGNQIISLPTLTGLPDLALLDVSDNKLDFASLETNVSIPGINYSNQADIGSSSTINLTVGESYNFELNVGGTQNHYQWKLNESALSGDTLNTYSIEAIGRASMGRYLCEISNSLVPGLILKTAVDTLYAITNLSGIVFSESSVPATSGTVMLLRVESEGGFDTTSVQTVNEDGSYLIEGVILDDYQLVSFIDTIEFVGAIPTYYKNTIYWEEADTLFVNNPMDSLDIITMYKPTEAPTGKGVISGYIVEDDGTPEGRIKKNKRVDNAGASVRKVERTGRGKEEVLTLIAYQFTNEEGEFLFTNLAEGEYRLNIQYPGYPMDENSFVTIPIGAGINSEKRVEAMVAEGKIVVRELIITSVWTFEEYRVEMYPNPTSSFIQVEFLSDSPSREVHMYDINGKKMISKNIRGKRESIDVRSLQKGHYLLNIQDKGVLVKTLQVIVE